MAYQKHRGPDGLAKVLEAKKTKRQKTKATAEAGKSVGKTRVAEYQEWLELSPNELYQYATKSERKKLGNYKVRCSFSCSLARSR